MSEVPDCLSIKETLDFVERDTHRILKRINNEPEPFHSEEFIINTDRKCMMMSYETFKKGYKQFVDDILGNVEDLRAQGFRMICRKIEVIPPEKDCGINGGTFYFKLTFDKQIL